MKLTLRKKKNLRVSIALKNVPFFQNTWPTCGSGRKNVYCLERGRTNLTRCDLTKNHRVSIIIDRTITVLIKMNQTLIIIDSNIKI